MSNDGLHIHDPLDYLPWRPLLHYPKRHVIYSGTCDSVYLVASGRVKVVSTGVAGRKAIVRIVAPEGLFGESSFAEVPTGERAIAIDSVGLMAWPHQELEEQIEKAPHLGLALLEHLVRLNCEMEARLQAMRVCKVPQRVMLSLLQLARQLGKRQADGKLQMRALTHQTIAEHVGTSREFVSSQMSRLRRLGLVRYSRTEMEVYYDAIEQALRDKGVALRALDGYC